MKNPDFWPRPKNRGSRLGSLSLGPDCGKACNPNQDFSGRSRVTFRPHVHAGFRHLPPTGNPPMLSLWWRSTTRHIPSRLSFPGLSCNPCGFCRRDKEHDSFGVASIARELSFPVPASFPDERLARPSPNRCLTWATTGLLVIRTSAGRFSPLKPLGPFRVPRPGRTTLSALFLCNHLVGVSISGNIAAAIKQG